MGSDRSGNTDADLYRQHILHRRIHPWPGLFLYRLPDLHALPQACPARASDVLADDTARGCRGRCGAAVRGQRLCHQGPGGQPVVQRHHPHIRL
ncbi:hypothetical protein D3C84_1113930 [compost metagenome]